MTFKLKRLRQCEKCPWKLSTDPREIPHGYEESLHRDLAHTIATPGTVSFGGPLRNMACHEHPPGEDAHCVGWLANQLGPGNNIALRIAMTRCENVGAIQLDGPQHERFEDTLPQPAEAGR
ncbi:hypothetical protein DLJ53_28850 [Acuticoccus sediminis]|uniref:Uncharacterized protein n=1 Tax=Acuticoccus sediminis TaxID=2184697 RepID=A0A8B2NQ01_9HYPH|nr:DUF6283 family protein [Acuticoccus sediminis]RAH97843.1 hypothetical protein DLJ53_28850 [Acuticoccus sediminis]